jgi:hypothetical protein
MVMVMDMILMFAVYAVEHGNIGYTAVTTIIIK